MKQIRLSRKSLIIAGTALALMVLGSALRILLWKMSAARELYLRGMSLALSCGILILWKRFSLGERLIKRPAASLALLYAAGVGLLLWGGFRPTCTEIVAMWGAIPLALTIVPVLYSQRGAGVRGFLAAAFAPAPAYVLLYAFHAVAGVLILFVIHVGLLFSACFADWFDSDPVFTILLFYLFAICCIPVLFTLFDSWNVISTRLHPPKYAPTSESWDYITRCVLREAGLFHVPPVDFPLYASVMNPYLLAQTLVSLGWIPALAASVLLLALAGAVCFTKRNGAPPMFWRKGAALSIAVPILFSLAQNWGCHISYVDIPLLTPDIPGNAMYLVLLFLLLRERKPIPESETETPAVPESVLLSVNHFRLPDSLPEVRSQMGWSGNSRDFPGKELQELLAGQTGCVLIRCQGSPEEVTRQLGRTAFETRTALAAWIERGNRMPKREVGYLVAAIEDSALCNHKSSVFYTSNNPALRRNQIVLTILLI